jgi:hypothetical protein
MQVMAQCASFKAYGDVCMPQGSVTLSPLRVGPDKCCNRAQQEENTARSFILRKRLKRAKYVDKGAAGNVPKTSDCLLMSSTLTLEYS